MRNHGPDTVNVALYVSPCCADIERNRSKKGGFFLQETMPCIHGPSLCVCVCVYACTRGSCVDSIWLWVRKETFSKPVFGVSKTSISGFVAVGPHCVCMLAVVVAVLIAYDYDCARTLWASRPFGGEAALARRESLQLRPCWPNIEPQMIGQKEEKKSWVARPVSQTNQRPPKPALNREGNKLWVRKLTPFLGPDLVLQTSFLRMHVLLKVNPWRVHLPCQLTRLQKHDSRFCVQLSQKIMALCPLWWFQPPILQHVFSCALYILYGYFWITMLNFRGVSWGSHRFPMGHGSWLPPGGLHLGLPSMGIEVAEHWPSE